MSASASGSSEKQLRFFVADEVLITVKHVPGLQNNQEALYESVNKLLQEASPKITVDRERANQFIMGTSTTQFLPGRLTAEDGDSALIDAVNKVYTAVQNQKLRSETVLITAVTPNWLMAGAPNNVGTGGPAGYPILASPKPGDDTFSTPDYGAPPPPAAANNVVEVIVLDTAPSSADLASVRAPDGRNNWLVTSLKAKLDIIDLCPSLVNPLSNPKTGAEACGHGYPMPDHGLFVAGIIHSIAPTAKLHLVRILGDYGIGSAQSIVLGLIYALGRAAQGSLIVNMSFTDGLPDAADIDNKCIDWPQLAKSVAEHDAFYQWLLTPLLVLIQALAQSDLALVAAAGNDSPDRTHRQPARYPARHPAVIGVGALNKAGSVADYSDFADDPLSDGVLALGGELNGPISGRDGCNCVPVPRSVNGVIGAYIGAFPDGTANTTGWAEWSGTSFAAPVVSGIIADHCQRGWNPGQVRHELLNIGLAEHPVAARQG